MRFDARSLVIALVLGAAGCPAVDVTQGLSTKPVAQSFDYNDFVCEAMPVLVKHCSYLGCHGNEQRALRIYSPGKLRASDVTTRNDHDAAMTTAEIDLNYASATGVLLGAQPANGDPLVVANALLLQKPLAARFGGSEHHGIGVFPVYPKQTLEDDPEWNALVSWVTGKKQASPLSGDCLDLFTSLGATPK